MSELLLCSRPGADSSRCPGVYLLTHKLSGLQYVGACTNLRRRLQTHTAATVPQSWHCRVPGLRDRFHRSSIDQRRVTPRVLEEMPMASLEEVAQAELDWWFLLKPALNGMMPTLRGAQGHRPTRSWTVDRLMAFVERERGYEPSRWGYYGTPKDKAWDLALEVMEEGAHRRRGDLCRQLLSEASHA